MVHTAVLFLTGIYCQSLSCSLRYLQSTCKLKSTRSSALASSSSTGRKVLHRVGGIKRVVSNYFDGSGMAEPICIVETACCLTSHLRMKIDCLAAHIQCVTIRAGFIKIMIAVRAQKPSHPLQRPESDHGCSAPDCDDKYSSALGKRWRSFFDSFCFIRLVGGFSIRNCYKY